MSVCLDLGVCLPTGTFAGIPGKGDLVSPLQRSPGGGRNSYSKPHGNEVFQCRFDLLPLSPLSECCFETYLWMKASPPKKNLLSEGISAHLRSKLRLHSYINIKWAMMPIFLLLFATELCVERRPQVAYTWRELTVFDRTIFDLESFDYTPLLIVLGF